MLNLQSFKDKLSLDGIIEDLPEDFLVFTRDSLFARKPYEKLNNYSGTHNVILGPSAGQHLKRASHNVMLGSGAGFNTYNKNLNKKYLSSYNVFLGKNAGFSNVEGYYNIYLGFENSKIAQNDLSTTVEREIRHNIGIGSKSSTTGGRSVNIGDDSYNLGTYSTLIGHENSNLSKNSLIIGEKIKNTGHNSFVLRANGKSSSTTHMTGLENSSNNYVNINDMFIGTTDELNVHVPITFLEGVSFSNDIVTTNLRVLDQLVSDNQALMNNVLMSNLTVTDSTVLSNNVLITKDPNNITDATFEVEIEATFSGLSRFVNKTIKNEDLLLDYRNRGLLDQKKSFTIRFTDDITVDFSIDEDQLFTRLPVLFENNVQVDSNLFVSGNTALSGDYNNVRNLHVDDISIYELFSSSNIASNVIEQIQWLRSNQEDILMSGFSNDLAPWLRDDPSLINLGIFDPTGLLPEWVKPSQSQVELADFKNEYFAPWLEADQSNVLMSQFSNDLAPWLKLNQGDVELDNFRFNDTYIWLKFPGHFSQTTYDISSFNNDFLNVQRESIFQANVNFQGGLKSFGDISDFQSASNLFRSNVQFESTVQVTGETVFESNVNVNSTLFVKDLVASNSNNEVIVEVDHEKVHVQGDFVISHDMSNVFTVIDSNISFGGANGLIQYEDPVLFQSGAVFASGGTVSLEPDTDLIVNGSVFINRNDSNLIRIEENDNKITFENSAFSVNYQTENIFQVQESNVMIGNGEFIIDSKTLLQDKLYVYSVDSNNDNWWSIFSSSQNRGVSSANLFFRSKNGATVRFDDKFEESILNFTGQHRCSSIQEEYNEMNNDITDFIGKIVCATGTYQDLNNQNVININESIPVVKLCKENKDKSVFGVISGLEEDTSEREFKVGHLNFVLNKEIHTRKLMINSVGEGGIWVCNINGEFKNGDYITSSCIEGYGMLQDDNIQYNHTVAKITCDCSFNLDSMLYKCVQFKYRGKVYRKAFVGCVYTC